MATSIRLKKSLLQVITGCILLFLLPLFMISCGGDTKENMTDPTCVKLTREQIQNWIDKGYIDPGVKGTVIRFRTVLCWPKTIFRVYAGVQKLDDGSLIPGSEIELSAAEDSCGGISLDDFTMTGTIQAHINEWNIFKLENGKYQVSQNLKYIRLKPYNVTLDDISFLALQDAVVNEDGTTSVMAHQTITGAAIEGLRPCPPCPNCLNPCPPPSSCSDTCSSLSVDSLLKQETITDTSLRK